MPSARAIFQAHVDDLDGGDFPVKVTFTSAMASGTRLSNITLASGDNTLDVPADTTWIIFLPPTDNTKALLLKGDVGDVGKTLHLTAPNVISTGGDVTIINAADVVVGADIIYI